MTGQEEQICMALANPGGIPVIGEEHCHIGAPAGSPVAPRHGVADGGLEG